MTSPARTFGVAANGTTTVVATPGDCVFVVTPWGDVIKPQRLAPPNRPARVIAPARFR